MRPDRPPNLRSLEARLRNLARERGIAEGRARRLIAILVLGRMLSRTRVAVLKGASNIEVRVGTANSRASSDLDVVRSTSLEEFRERLAEELRTGWEGFSGLLIDVGEISTLVPGAYRPHRFRVKVGYKERDFATVPVEVSPAEIDGKHVTEAVAPTDAAAWFGELGFPDPGPLPALPLAHQIAQKLHACTLPDEGGWVNDRVHDLVDLQQAVAYDEGAMEDLREVAVRLFNYRNRHTWPPHVTPRVGWRDRYRAEAEGLEVVQDLSEAVVWANELIAKIEASQRRSAASSGEGVPPSGGSNTNVV